MALLTYFFDWMRRLLLTFSNQVPHVVTYTRELPINLERMYENALDWEHLPWLHSTTFSHLEVLDSGDWGWRAKAYMHPQSFLTSMIIELRLDRDKNRWITKTHKGLGKGTEIWTHAIPLGENKIKVIVDFYVPKLPFWLKKSYAEQYTDLYARLYDEDLWMMASRQEELDRVEKAHDTEKIESLSLGHLEEVESKLPLAFEFNHHPYRLVKTNNEFLVHSLSCPHMLGPLNDASIKEGVLECPWHGYQFDIQTGKCISGQKCRLARPPKIEVNADTLEVTAKL